MADGPMRWKAMAACPLVLVAAFAVAAPAEDFERARVAYQRGDVAAAMRLLRAPAEAGHAPSQSLLAFVLDRGDFPEDAVRWWTRAAAQGDAEALAALGQAALTGRGIAKDEKAALEHFSKAASLGHVPSALLLADAHLTGTLGLRRDDVRAGPDLRRAAEAGHLPAAEAIEKGLREGSLGLAADPEEADRWRVRIAQWRRERSRPVATAR